MQDLILVRITRGEAIIKALDGSMRAIPLWMTDESICWDLRRSPHPYCSCRALQRLRRLLDGFKQAGASPPGEK